MDRKWGDTVDIGSDTFPHFWCRQNLTHHYLLFIEVLMTVFDLLNDPTMVEICIQREQTSTNDDGPPFQVEGKESGTGGSPRELSLLLVNVESLPIVRLPEEYRLGLKYT